ncbi:MAG: RagB/SusD family nutrient uptake outer membrane protein [Prolixibacteraceae bacterium]
MNNIITLNTSISKATSFGLLAIFLFTSCNTFFEPEDTTIVDIKTRDDFNSATGGVKDLLMYWMIDFEFCKVRYFGDDLLYGQIPYYYYYNQNLDVGVGTETDPELSEEYWKKLYQIIISVNNVMVQYDDAKFDFDGINQSLGELLFIRAYCYFLMVRLYGNIPIVKDIVINEKLAKASYQEIYSFIENDLKRALPLVLKSKDRNECFSLDQACVKGLLTEVYLSWAGFPAKDISKYSEAAKTAGELIDNASQYNLAFIDNLNTLWTEGMVNTGEDLFCYYTNNIEIGHKLIAPYYRFYNPVSAHGNFYSSEKVGYSNLNRYEVEATFYNNFPKGFRKDLTFFTSIYVPEDLTGTTKRDTGIFYINHIVDKIRPVYRKFFIDTTNYKPSSPAYSSTSPKINFLRLTHTILTYAEAQARTGEVTTKAYEWINKIRRRANNVPVDVPSMYDLPIGLSPEAFADSVLLERTWELAGEFEGRWFDLVRLEKVEEVYNAKVEGDKESYFIENPTGTYFLEIPVYDQLINPNLE